MREPVLHAPDDDLMESSDTRMNKDSTRQGSESDEDVEMDDPTAETSSKSDDDDVEDEECDDEGEEDVSCATAMGIDVPNVIEAPNWPSYLVNTDKDVGKPLFRRLLHWGPLLAIGITTLIGMTTTIVHVDWWPITEPLAFLNLSVFLLLNYGVFTNLLQASYVGGGYVTRGWHPPEQEQCGRLQYCAVCCGYKAPRSHHCNKCNRCVMKMDHHCPWINNCVGHRNHVYFFRFLFFAVVGCLHAVIICGITLYHTLTAIFKGRDSRHRQSDVYVIPSMSQFIFVMLSVSFGVGVILAVGVLLYTQLMIIIRNKTGVEDYICSKAMYRERTDDFIFPYDLGKRRNIREVLSWFSPMPRGNGIWWPIREGSTQFSFSEEQIIQKANKRYAARIYDVIKDHNGGVFGAYKAGAHALFCQPCSDESRIAVKKGESYAVTRANKHWFYGQRLLSLNDPDHKETDKDNGDDNHEFISNPYADRASRDQRTEMALKQALQPRGWFPRNTALSRHKQQQTEQSDKKQD